MLGNFVFSESASSAFLAGFPGNRRGLKWSFLQYNQPGRLGKLERLEVLRSYDPQSLLFSGGSGGGDFLDQFPACDFYEIRATEGSLPPFSMLLFRVPFSHEDRDRDSFFEYRSDIRNSGYNDVQDLSAVSLKYHQQEGDLTDVHDHINSSDKIAVKIDQSARHRQLNRAKTGQIPKQLVVLSKKSLFDADPQNYVWLLEFLHFAALRDAGFREFCSGGESLYQYRSSQRTREPSSSSGTSGSSSGVYSGVFSTQNMFSPFVINSEQSQTTSVFVFTGLSCAECFRWQLAGLVAVCGADFVQILLNSATRFRTFNSNPVFVEIQRVQRVQHAGTQCGLKEFDGLRMLGNLRISSPGLSSQISRRSVGDMQLMNSEKVLLQHLFFQEKFRDFPQSRFDFPSFSARSADLTYLQNFETILDKIVDKKFRLLRRKNWLHNWIYNARMEVVVSCASQIVHLGGHLILEIAPLDKEPNTSAFEQSCGHHLSTVSKNKGVSRCGRSGRGCCFYEKRAHVTETDKFD